MKNTSNGQTVLITGASSGIGYELTKLFAENGYNIIGVSRHEEDLKKVARDFEPYGVKVDYIVKDLFETNAGTELYEEVKRRKITVDILVNDAGQGVFGLFTERSLEDYEKIVHLNIMSLTRLTYHFLKEMLARNSGKILNVGSMLSEWPSPYNAVYAATKAYVASLTEAIRSECEESAVTLTVLEPPGTNTNFWPVSGSLPSKSYVEGTLAEPSIMVAKEGFDALMAGKDKVVPGFGNKAFMAVTNILPDTTVAGILKNQSEPVKSSSES